MFPYLVVIQSLQGSAVTLGIINTESRQELEHLLLHLAAVGVQRWEIGGQYKNYWFISRLIWPKVDMRLVSPEICVDSDWQRNFSTKHLEARCNILVLIKAKLRSMIRSERNRGFLAIISCHFPPSDVRVEREEIGRVDVICDPACCLHSEHLLIRQMQR